MVSETLNTLPRFTLSLSMWCFFLQAARLQTLRPQMQTRAWRTPNMVPKYVQTLLKFATTSAATDISTWGQQTHVWERRQARKVRSNTRGRTSGAGGERMSMKLSSVAFINSDVETSLREHSHVSYKAWMPEPNTVDLVTLNLVAENSSHLTVQLAEPIDLTTCRDKVKLCSSFVNGSLKGFVNESQKMIAWRNSRTCPRETNPNTHLIIFCFPYDKYLRSQKNQLAYQDKRYTCR